MKKVDGCVYITASLTDGSFFKKWLTFLKPFHALTEREMDVAALFLKKRYELSKVIHDSNLLDQVVMGPDTRKQMLEECGLKLPHFQVIVSKMKKCGIIVDDKLNPKFIPDLKEGAEDFKMLLYFSLK